MELQQNQKQLLELFANFKANPAPISTPLVVVLVVDELIQEAMPTNADSLSIVRRQTNMTKELDTFITHSEIEAMFKREKASVSSPDWKPQ